MTAVSNGEFRLWDPTTRRSVGETLQVNLATRITFSPTGDSVALQLSNGIQLVNARTGKPAGDLLVDELQPAFSHDGTLLATLDDKDDASVRLWSTADGSQVGVPLEDASSSISKATFSPYSQILASGSSRHDGVMRPWNVDLYRDPVRSLCNQAGPMSQDEWKKYAADEPYANASP